MAIAIARRSGASLAKYCATLMVGRLIISLAGLRVFRADMWRPQRAPLQTGLAPGCGPWTRYAGWSEPRHELEPLRPRDAPSGDFGQGVPGLTERWGGWLGVLPSIGARMMKRSWSTVWARQSDGTWKAIHDNWNYDSK